jgi:hypothetical protein
MGAMNRASPRASFLAASSCNSTDPDHDGINQDHRKKSMLGVRNSSRPWRTSNCSSGAETSPNCCNFNNDPWAVPTGEPHPMDLVLRKNPGRMLCTPRVHTRLHWSTLPADVANPRLAHRFIALGSFQRGGRQHSLTSETYPPSVTRGQHRTSVQFVTDSRTPQAREWMTPLLQTQDPMGRSVGCGFAPGARRNRDATLYWRLNT